MESSIKSTSINTRSDSPLTMNSKFIEIINYNKFMVINKSPTISPVTSHENLQKKIYSINIKPKMSLSDPLHSQR